MAKKKAKTKKEKIIKIVIEKRNEPLKVPDLKIPDSSDLGMLFC